MITFLVNGIGVDDLLYVVDDAIKDNANECSPVYIVSTYNVLEIQCYDSELGKQYTGAQALAVFIDARRKQNDAKPK